MTTFDSLALLLIILILLPSLKCCGKVFWTQTTFEPPCPSATATSVLFKDFVSPALLATALLATAIIATAIAATECCHWDYCCHRDCFVKGLCSKTQAALFAISCPSTILFIIIMGRREIDLSFLPSLFMGLVDAHCSLPNLKLLIGFALKRIVSLSPSGIFL